jgi:hypothetical protein
MIRRQLELGFENQPGLKPAGRRRGRSSRAHWWFERMRGVVNHAGDWPPVSPLAEAPLLPAERASSGPEPSEAAPRASVPVPPGTDTKAPSAAEPRR